MKKPNYFSPGRIFNCVLGALALAAFLAGASPASAAATSAYATIHNIVDVQWSSGTATYHAANSVDVRVATVAALPTIYNSTTTATVAAGATATYSTAIASNANGPDTYIFNAQAVTLSNVPAAVYTNGAPTRLWGGMIVGVPSNNVISLPGGSISTVSTDPNYLSATATLVIGGKLYTISSISVGNAAAGAVAGASPVPATAEVLATVTVVPASAAYGFAAGTAIASGSLTGVQVGEVVNVTSLSFTAGNPADPSLTPLTYTNPFTISTTATSLGGAVLTTSPSPTFSFVTTVQVSNLSINKYYRVITGGSQGTVTTSVNTGSIAATFPGTGSPKPGEYIEYCIVIHNTGSAAATGNIIKDPVPPYTTYATGTTYALTNVAGPVVTPLAAVADVAGNSALLAGYNFANLAPNNYAIVVYQLKVD